MQAWRGRNQQTAGLNRLSRAWPRNLAGTQLYWGRKTRCRSRLPGLCLCHLSCDRSDASVSEEQYWYCSGLFASVAAPGTCDDTVISDSLARQFLQGLCKRPMRSSLERKRYRARCGLIDALSSRVTCPAEHALLSWQAPSSRRGSSGGPAFRYDSLAGPSHVGDYTLNNRNIEDFLRYG